MVGLVKKLNEQCVQSTESAGAHGGSAGAHGGSVGREAMGTHV